MFTFVLFENPAQYPQSLITDRMLINPDTLHQNIFNIKKPVNQSLLNNAINL